MLVGNKKDLDEERTVTVLEASRFAQENGTSLLLIHHHTHARAHLALASRADLMFLETSARTGENVEETFLKCARTILSKVESGHIDPERMGSGIQFGDLRSDAQRPAGDAAGGCAC